MKIEKAIETLQNLIDSNIYTSDIDNTFNLAISALEKQVPKKVVKAEYDYNCPICGYEYLVNEKYCANCGQKLSWLEVEND